MSSGQFISETLHQRTIRRLLSCTHTLNSIVEELEDPENVEERGDLLIAVEDLIDAAQYVTSVGRYVAWQDEEENESEDVDLDADGNEY